MRSFEQSASFSPLYQQIKDLIVASLQAGEWQPGHAIPSEMELAERYKVSQGTVRKAIDALAAENLVVRHQGRGTFVASHREEAVQYRFLRLMPDDGNELINVGQRHGQTFQYMAALAGFAQGEDGATGHHFAAVL